MKKLTYILNDNPDRKTWFAKNYFWAGTIFVILICALLFLIGGSDWNPINYDYAAHGWSDGLYVNPLFFGFLNSFGHSNLQHMLLNMLCFLIAGLYLERKIGTLKLLLLIFAFAFLSTGITAANSRGVGSIGYSGVNFALYFYIIVDYIFILCQKAKRNKTAIILGAVMLVLIYLAMSFNGGTSGFGFAWYPYDLFHNQGHMGGAIAGIIVGLLVHVSKFGHKQKTE